MVVNIKKSKSKICKSCGCTLEMNNKSFDSDLCKACFDSDMADLEDEDMAEDSMADDERLADFLG